MIVGILQELLHKKMIFVDTNDKNIFILIMRHDIDESLRQIATSVKIPFFGNKKLQPTK